MNKLRLSAFVLFSVLLFGSANAQLLQQFRFNGSTGQEVTFPPDGQPQNGALSEIKRGSGLLPSAANNVFSAKGFTADAAVDTADYFAFAIKAGAGFQLNLDSLVFGQKRSNSGVRTYSLRSSLDGFSQDILTDSGSVVISWNNKAVLGSAFQGIAASQTVEFRFFGYNCPSANGTWRLDSIRIYGNIGTGGGVTPKPSLTFSPSSLSFTEGNAAQNAGILLSSASSLPISAALFVKSGTAQAGSDYTAFSSLPVSMQPGSSLSQNVQVNFLDDAAVEQNETLSLVIRKLGLASDTAFQIGADSIFTFTINDNDAPVVVTGPPTRTIAEIIGAGSGNQADSVGKSFRVYGTVYGLNQRLSATTGGYQMYLRDASGGLGLFKNAFVSGVNVLNEGDSVRVMGKIEGFRGLSQINPDSMVVIATGRTLKTPVIASSINESLESNLVRINGVQLVNPASWTTSAGTGFTVRVFKGTDTTDVRIDNDCPLFNQAAPAGLFDIIGMGSQFIAGNPAPTAPFAATGYQLIPRKSSDLIIASSPGSKPVLSFSSTALSFTESAGNQNLPVSITAAPSLSVQPTAYIKGGTATAGTDYAVFASVFSTMGPGQATSLNLPVEFLDDAVNEPSETLVMVLRKSGLPSDTAYEIGADSIFTFTINDNDSPVVVTGPATRTIAQIVGSSAGNQADSVGKSFRIYGTVYGLNQRLSATTGGYQMFLRDGSGGIGIFKNAPVSGISTLTEGDSVRVMGKIECFRGLSQVNLDSMVIISSGNSLKAPTPVTFIGEAQESDLVKMDGLTINPATWTTGLGNGGFTAKAFNGTDTIAIRIDNDCELYNAPIPSGTVSMTGMVGQFVPGNPAPVAPFPASGYQLIPRRASDLIINTSLSPSCHCSRDLSLVPNPGNDFVSIGGQLQKTELLQITDLRGRVLKEISNIGSQNRIDVSSLPESIYLFRFVESGQVLRWVKGASR